MPGLPSAGLIVAIIFILWCSTGAAQQYVHFPSLDDNGAGQPPTMLDGYLVRPAGEARHPAVVFLHGCGGLFSHAAGGIEVRERDWAAELSRRGYVVLMVDSFASRHQGSMCRHRDF